MKETTIEDLMQIHFDDGNHGFVFSYTSVKAFAQEWASLTPSNEKYGWVKCSDRLPSLKVIDTYFVKQKVKDSDEDWFPGTSTFSGEWEISDGYEVIEWLEENI